MTKPLRTFRPFPPIRAYLASRLILQSPWVALWKLVGRNDTPAKKTLQSSFLTVLIVLKVVERLAWKRTRNRPMQAVGERQDPSMKIHPTPQTLAMLAWASWGIIGVESLVVDLLTVKPFAALIAAAVALSVVSAIRYNAQRIEVATREHAALMARQVLTIERFFDMGRRSDAQAKRDAAFRPMNGHDTGPFTVYNGGTV